MENQSRLKLRISRMFRSSFGSCKPRTPSDVIERPVFAPVNRQETQLIELFSPKPRIFPSMCRPKSCESSGSDLLPRPKVSDRYSLLADGRKCPPASPISPFYPLFDRQQSACKPKQKKPAKKTNKKTRFARKGSFDSFDDYYDWFSSDEDDDKATLFSSKSLSSDSSDSFRRRQNRHRRRRAAKKETAAGDDLMPIQGKVKDSFAVVKRSSDPYSDFRKSMVEMIVEKQIFGGRDLENLLQTFLSLNSYHHHRVIIRVFTEIWETLFSDCP